MSLFGRRERQELVAITAAEPAVMVDLIVRSQNTYRVAVAHVDADHPNAVAAHWGPAFNGTMADTIAHVRDVDPVEVDLLEEARHAAERCSSQHGDGYRVWVERLVERDGESEWERVT